MRRTISLSGSPGSGKSTVAKKLATHLGYERISMGDIRRQMAAEKGMDLATFNSWSETHPEGDVEVDKLWQRLEAEGKEGVIAEGRMAFFFLPSSIKIFLELNTTEAAQRIWSHWDAVQAARNEHQGVDSQQALQASLDSRIASDSKRYQHYYNVDIFDKNHYDIWIDVAGMDADREFTAVLQALDQFKADLPL